MRLNFGRRFFTDNLALDGEGAGDPPVLTSVEPRFRTKFTFLGVGLEAGGIFIPTKSLEDTSEAMEGISRRRFCLLQL